MATQHEDETFSHFFFRSLHDCRKIPTYFARLSQRARDYMMYSSSSGTRGHATRQAARARGDQFVIGAMSVFLFELNYGRKPDTKRG
jgi:hypothetical protein